MNSVTGCFGRVPAGGHGTGWTRAVERGNLDRMINGLLIRKPKFPVLALGSRLIIWV